MAEDVIGLFEHLNWPKADILGFSMGGAIAQEIAIRHPERVDRLVLTLLMPLSFEHAIVLRKFAK
jgi:pimeloyl-ACP methyl ester carboxylesterase